MPDAPVTLHLAAQPSYMVHVETYSNFYIDYDKRFAFEGESVTVSAHPISDTDPDDFTGWIWHVVYYEDGQPVDVDFTPDATETNRIHFVMPAYDVTVSLTSPVSYVDRWWGGSQVRESIENPLVYNLVRSETANLTTGLWIADRNCTFSDGMTVSGNVELVLCDGVTITVEKEGLLVPEGSSLTIYGQTGGTGTLHATGSRGDAGIGGGRNSGNRQQGNGGRVTILGGYVFAASETVGAGIGGGGSSDGTGIGGDDGTVIVDGGFVVAATGSYSYDWVNYRRFRRRDPEGP